MHDAFANRSVIYLCINLDKKIRSSKERHRRCITIMFSATGPYTSTWFSGKLQGLQSPYCPDLAPVNLFFPGRRFDTTETIEAALK